MEHEYRPIDADDVLAALPPERQALIKARAAELIASERALREQPRSPRPKRRLRRSQP